MATPITKNMSRKRINEISNSDDFGQRQSATKTFSKSPRFAFDGRYIWIVLFIFYFSIFSFVRHRLYVFPEPQSQIPGVSPNDSFYETNARIHLKHFSLHGPRVVGSAANEVYAYKYILNELNVIKHASLPSKEILIDEQNVTGAFDIAFLSDYVSVYRNIKNIVVMLKSETESEHSLLMSCHFDSAVGSPGAGDNAISCSVMLELLRVFSQSPDKLNHNIIFLFNGAEENLLQASHGFITTHPWSKSIRAFVNIDSAGAGGWEFVFQAGPAHPWLVRAYAESSPYPSGSIFGQDMFQSGLIPSDTDYRIYRDFGEIPGLDIAYISNGYVYHTANDQNRFIEPGCVQRGGENLLALLRKLSSSPKLADPGLEKEGTMIFFDLVGYVMIYYPQRVAIVINSALVAAVFFKILQKSVNIDGSAKHDVKYFRNLLEAIMYMMLTWVVIILICVAMALVVTVTRSNMSWFSTTYNLIPLFILPPLIGVFILHEYLRNSVLKDKSNWYNEQIFFESNLTIWCILLLVLTLNGIGSAFFPMMFVLGPLIIRDRTFWIFKNTDWKDHSYSFLMVHLISLLLPTLTVMYVGYASTSLFIPIMGRSGTEVNADIAIGVIVGLLVIPVSGYLVGIYYICSNMKKVTVVLGGIVVVWLIAIVFTPLGFPFSGDVQQPRPMRILAVHALRHNHDIHGAVTHEDSGIWLVPFDCTLNRHLVNHMPALKDAKPVTDCGLGPYCGLPWLIPVITLVHPKKSLYLQVGKHDRPSVKCVLAKTQTDGIGFTKMSFEVTGPDHITMQVRPHKDVSLEIWSLSSTKPEPTAMPADIDETTYFVYYSHGETPMTPWSFSLHFKVPEGYSTTEGIVDIAFAGHYLHSKDKETQQMDEFLSQAPDWATPVTWASTWDGYVF